MDLKFCGSSWAENPLQESSSPLILPFHDEQSQFVAGFLRVNILVGTREFFVYFLVYTKESFVIFLVETREFFVYFLVYTKESFVIFLEETIKYFVNFFSRDYRIFCELFLVKTIEYFVNFLVKTIEYFVNFLIDSNSKKLYL